MHPVLGHAHSDCKENIENLLNCHKDFPVKKFFGHCNRYKEELDACLQENVCLFLSFFQLFFSIL